jgi:CP2 transcription factor
MGQDFSLMDSDLAIFRFHATLDAVAVMVKYSGEILVTYLSKGQAYLFSIVDTVPKVPISPGTRYRTFVRVSFEGEQQHNAAICWGLWEEGRETNDARQCNGKLLAVEHVEGREANLELETVSFDGFSVIWTPSINGAAECNIPVRFSFLSTDFSYSQ